MQPIHCYWPRDPDGWVKFEALYLHLYLQIKWKDSFKQQVCLYLRAIQPSHPVSATNSLPHSSLHRFKSQVTLKSLDISLNAPAL